MLNKTIEIKKRMDLLWQEEKMLEELPMPPAQNLVRDALSDKTSEFQSAEELQSFIHRY